MICVGLLLNSILTAPREIVGLPLDRISQRSSPSRLLPVVKLSTIESLSHGGATATIVSELLANFLEAVQSCDRSFDYLWFEITGFGAAIPKSVCLSLWQLKAGSVGKICTTTMGICSQVNGGENPFLLH